MNKRLVNNVLLNVTHVQSCWKILQISKGKENICYKTKAEMFRQKILNQKKMEGYGHTDGFMNSESYTVRQSKITEVFSTDYLGGVTPGAPIGQ